MSKTNNKSILRLFFTQTGTIIAGIILAVSTISFSCSNPENKAAGTFKGAPPVIMVCFSWSFSNIGDVGITPGLLSLLQQNIPEAEIIVVTNSHFEDYKTYLPERYPKCSVIPSPFSAGFKEISPEFREAFDRADMVLFNSGTTLSYGRWEYNWNRTMRFAMPLFMAREAGKPYGIYCQSFEKFAWPSNELFVPMLSDASFVFSRDGNSLEYLESLGVAPPVLEFGPDATFAFNLFDTSAGNTFMQKHGLKPRQFITITIRTSGQGFIDETREQAHAAKLRQLIETYVDRTGHDVLICPEVIHEIEPARRLILEPLPGKIRQHVKFKEEFWLPDEALSVYSQAEVIVSMEMHSIILGLAVGTPVLHPRFVEAGRKAWMLRDLGIEEWLFDIDKEPVDRMTAGLLEIHNNYDAALEKVKSAMDIVHDRQLETMAIVRQTLVEATTDKHK